MASDGTVINALVPGSGLLAIMATVGLVGANNVTTGVPTNGISGYAPGCLFINSIGSAGSLVYTNVGTSTSATWLNIA
jgi:hypothetical protein